MCYRIQVFSVKYIAIYNNNNNIYYNNNNKDSSWLLITKNNSNIKNARVNLIKMLRYISILFILK